MIKNIFHKVLAQTTEYTTISLDFASANPFQLKFGSIKDLIETIADVLFYLGTPLFILVTLIGGIIFLTAGVSIENAKKGKEWIQWGLIGLAVVLGGRLIFELFLTLF